MTLQFIQETPTLALETLALAWGLELGVEYLNQRGKLSLKAEPSLSPAGAW